jgi:hypothetical protein
MALSQSKAGHFRLNKGRSMSDEVVHGEGEATSISTCDMLTMVVATAVMLGPIPGCLLGEKMLKFEV